MPLYIALLRGINVSGKNLIRMEALRKSVENLGFSRVTTYLQSGNIVFEAPEPDPGKIALRLTEAIRNDFGYDVPVLVLSAEKLTALAAANPLAGDASLDAQYLHVTFLSGYITFTDTDRVQARCRPEDRFIITASAVYLWLPDGYGNSKLTNTFFESLLGVTATTRNWKTVTQLLILVKSE
jgi:uncharacterized protein (DUF1697 family)